MRFWQRAFLLTFTGCLTVEFATGGGGAGNGGAGGVAPGGGGSAGFGGDAGGSGGDGGGPPLCGVGECAEVSPGFTGPFVVETGGRCFRGMEVASGGLVEMAPGFTVSPATCNCTCQPPPFLGCAPVTINTYSATGCGGAATQLQAAEDACVPVNGVNSFDVGSSGGTYTAMCASDGALPSKIDPEFDAPAVMCDAPLAPCGEGAVCVPEDTRVCLISEGETPCPAGFPVSLPFVRKDDLMDTRDCSCSCTSTGGPCQATLTAYSDGGCATPLIGSMGACADPVAAINGIRYEPPAQGACEPPVVEVTGNVTALIVVMCCNQ